MSYSINRASWPRKTQVELSPDCRSSGNQILRWSVASCSAQPKPGSGYCMEVLVLLTLDEPRYVESTPYSSVYHYDSSLTSSPKPPGGGKECYRYSLPVIHGATSQEGEDIPYRRQCTVRILYIDA